ncbi:MAG: HAD superfamily, subfamily IIIB-domain-containing protein [Monoraphidium minutum]|nr:MAG: HAD superfamily, subfamily IIIB-domain-containing protein [Monoraphidium minutum]
MEAISASRRQQVLLLCCGLSVLAHGVRAQPAAPAARATPTVLSEPKAAAAGSCFATECILPVGGGSTTSNQGLFPKAEIPACAGKLKTYFFSGEYERSVAAASVQALKALGLPPAKAQLDARRKQLVVFDIDETLVSNVALLPTVFRRRRLGEADLLAMRDAAADAAPPPALKPMLGVYKAVCAAGHPIALITGRSESKRAATAAALKAVGYGGACAGGARNGDGKTCCYTELALRPEGDTRLASVVKPEARERIAKKHGLEIYAGFGDQYSDFNGLWSPAYAFKLPNPFYTIL